MRLFRPPMKWIRWPFSPFATVVMVVFPIFWPVLAVILLAEAFGVAVWLLVLIVGNAVMLLAMLAAALVSRGRPGRQHHPGRDAAPPPVR